MDNAMQINFHHLRYFHAIAKEGSLTRAAKRLSLSQSALSVQLKRFEQSLGMAMFAREHKSLVLTEAGRLTLDHAESIFRLGDELLDTLQNRSTGQRQLLRIGAVGTLSRNFQLQFLSGVMEMNDVELVLRSGSLRDLLTQLQTHSIDVVLSNQSVKRDRDNQLFSHLLAEQPVSLVSAPVKRKKAFRFPEDLDGLPIILPGPDSSIRSSFDVIMDRYGVRPVIAAEVDDMAMLRLLARDQGHLALVPIVVVRDELDSKRLVERYRFDNLRERFYAITPNRRFPNPLVKQLVTAPQWQREH
jgi:LysR family transcriptional regulator, transcriptional activator of nhaA